MAIPAHPPNNLLGQTIGPGYRLVALLDATGRAAVYRAWDYTADRYVVVKVAHRAADAAALERVQRDVLTFGEAALPNVVPMLASGSHGLSPYVVLPYLAGGTLRQRRPIDNNRPLLAHPSLLHAWLPAIATALDALHDRGLAHGAVTPDDILFDAAQQPSLADVRIAAAMRAADPGPGEPAATWPDDPSGRFRYGCPQRLLGAAPSPAGDQFSLAAIVYDYLGAQPPFAGSTAADVAFAQAAHDTTPIELLSPKLPPSLCRALHRGLAHNPRDRHTSCRDFAKAVLEQVPLVDLPRKLRLVCPACRNLVAIEPAAAGRTGNCLSCQTQIEVDQELRWLALTNDRRADLPVAGAEMPDNAARRRWMPVALASLAAAVAFVMLSLRSPEPPPPAGAPDQEAAPAIAPTSEPLIAAKGPEPAEPGVSEPDPAAPRQPPPPIPHLQAAVVNEPPKAMFPIDPPKPAVDDAPATAPPAQEPAPPAGDARPIARDIAMDEVRAQLQTLHGKRRELMAARDKLEQTIVDQQAILTGSARAFKQSEIGSKEAERSDLTWQLSFATTPAQRAFLSQQIRGVDAELTKLRDELGKINKDLVDAQAAIVKATAELEKNGVAIHQFRREWVAFLNPLERDHCVAIKIKELSSESLESPEFIEARLYRALLYIVTGNESAARADLSLFKGKLEKSSEPLLGSVAVDFVYANLMVGNGPGARECLAAAEKHCPNDPILQHILALCEMEENNFTGAAKLFKAALRNSKSNPPRDRVLLCSDAAWLFAACPNGMIRNPKLATDNANEAITTAPGKAWQAWRARAALDAEAGNWDAAAESLEKARGTAPLVVLTELDAQQEAITAKQPYRIARK
jgi:tetratricopeptide (TPR) repeat protein